MAHVLSPEVRARRGGGSRQWAARAVVLAVAALLTVVQPASTAKAVAVEETPLERAQAVLAQMTLAEKIDMLHGEVNPYYGFYNAGIPRLGIPALAMADGPAGVRVADGAVNDKQSTALPAPIALAASWDTELSRAYGDLAGGEAYDTNHNMLLSPAVDIGRVGQAGRAFEAFGEDPLLSGKMAAAQIQGIQQNPVIADIKHFSAYNQETNRLSDGNAVVSERALHEIYGRPFEIGIAEGNPGSAMCAFNKVNYDYACENSVLLTEVLREQLDFQGWVMSDYGATHSTVPALKAGLDQEMPGVPNSQLFADRLLEAVDSGQVTESEIDRSVLRILVPMFEFGLFDNPVRVQAFDEVAHAAESQRIAEQGMVLLKNTKGVLPISRNARSIAVIGTDADTAVAGGGSSLVNPTGSISPLDGIEARAGSGVSVTHVAGSDPVGSGTLVPGVNPIPSDYLRAADGTAGLDATFYESASFGNETLHKVVPYPALWGGFFWFEGFNSQSPHLPQLPFYFSFGSMKYTGTLTPPVTGSYEFEVTGTGQSSLSIDGNEVISTGSGVLESGTASVRLVAGRSYELQLEYVNGASGRPELGPHVKLGWTMPTAVVAPQAKAAARAAKAADVAVVFVRDYGTEGGDRPSMRLPLGQEELIKAVSAANRNTIVVMTTAGPTITSTWDRKVAGIVDAFYGGQNQGAAIARILFGDVNPSGKLPVTIPTSDAATPLTTTGQFPGVGLDTFYTEGVYVGYRGYDELNIQPDYEFGFGLSYTKFRVSDLRAEVTNGSEIEASVTVTNTGKVAGAEVVQAYIGELPTTVVDTPQRQLAGWAKVDLQPGRSKTVAISLDKRMLSYWDSYSNEWITPSGPVSVYVGTSSRNLPLETQAVISSSDTENNPGVVAGQAYSIVSTKSYACLDAKDQGTGDGTRIQQWSCPAPAAHQQWNVIADSDGYVRLENRNAPGKVLDVEGGAGATQDGRVLQLWTSFPDATNQEFMLERLSEGAYRIVARHSGKCLEVAAPVMANGSSIVQNTCTSGRASQRFELNPQVG